MAADIKVFQKIFPGKAGAPITNATFAQVITLNFFKPPNLVPLPVLPPGGPDRNDYAVSLQTGPTGMVRVTAPGHGSDDVAIDDSGRFQALI